MALDWPGKHSAKGELPILHAQRKRCFGTHLMMCLMGLVESDATKASCWLLLRVRTLSICALLLFYDDNTFTLMIHLCNNQLYNITLVLL